MLISTFKNLVLEYSAGQHQAEELWQELSAAYSGKKRHYHTLAHLDHLLGQLRAVREQISDWNTVLFSLFYHDAVYNVLRNDNEEESARFAEERLTAISVPPEVIAKCKGQILATKTHTVSLDSDTNLFTDADLSILGQPRAVYEAYAKQVRKEYSIYPDLLYRPGRKRVLHHFLDSGKLFKTAHFFDAFELQARANLQWELESL